VRYKNVLTYLIIHVLVAFQDKPEGVSPVKPEHGTSATEITESIPSSPGTGNC